MHYSSCFLAIRISHANCPQGLKPTPVVAGALLLFYLSDTHIASKLSKRVETYSTPVVSGPLQVLLSERRIREIRTPQRVTSTLCINEGSAGPVSLLLYLDRSLVDVHGQHVGKPLVQNLKRRQKKTGEAKKGHRRVFMLGMVGKNACLNRWKYPSLRCGHTTSRSMHDSDYNAALAPLHLPSLLRQLVAEAPRGHQKPSTDRISQTTPHRTCR